MNDYKRLTSRGLGGTQAHCQNCFINDKCDYNVDTCLDEVVDRLCELEDKIENGTLIECNPNLIGHSIVGIHHYTNGTYELDLDDNIVIGFTTDGIVTWNDFHKFNDFFKHGLYFLTKEEAEKRLKELKNG